MGENYLHFLLILKIHLFFKKYHDLKEVENKN